MQDSSIEKKLKIIQAEMCWTAGEFSLLAECVRLKYKASVIFHLLKGKYVYKEIYKGWLCLLDLNTLPPETVPLTGTVQLLYLLFPPTSQSFYHTFIYVYNKASTYNQI